MDAPLDLYRATRDELIALIGRLREQQADQAQEIARLRGEVVTQRAMVVQLSERVGALLAALEPPDGDDPPARPTGMPGLKPGGRTRGLQPRGPDPDPPRSRVRAAADETDGAAGACLRPVSPLCDGAARRDGQAQPRGDRARRCGAALSPLPGTLAAGTGAGRRGHRPGSAGSGTPPSDYGLTGGVAAANRADPVVFGSGAWPAPERRGHRGHAAHRGGAGGAAGGPDAGDHPGQSGAACR